MICCTNHHAINIARSLVAVLLRRLGAVAGALLVAFGLLHPAPCPASAGECNGVWVELPVAGPPARFNHSMVYDSGNDVVVLCGGYSGGDVADTWTWNGAKWKQATTTATGVSPPRHDSGMAYHTVNATTVLFGGAKEVSCQQNPLLGDTWTWDGISWLHLDVSGPSNRSAMAMTYDPVRERTVLFGGVDGCSGADSNNETWEWDGSTWNQQATGGEPSRHLTATWFDPRANTVRVFGGVSSTTYSADMWEWSGTAWSQVTQVSPPPGRHSHAAAYDAASDRLVLFGGNGGPPGGLLADTWLFDGTNWVASNVVEHPTKRDGPRMVYDPARAQVVLFGGNGPGGPYGDTWIWSPRPILTEHPESTVTCSFGVATFSVVADGVGPFTYQWQRLDADGKPAGDLVDGSYVDPKTGLTYDVAGANTPSVTISNIVVGNHSAVLAFSAVVNNDCGATMSVLATIALPDFNGDGIVNGGDLAVVLAGWSTAAGDLTGDGVTDGADLALVLAAWGPCAP